MIRLLAFGLVLPMLFSAFSAIAQTTLTVQEVLASSRTSFPTILRARESIEAAKGKVTERQGAFDATLEQEFYGRPSGFYEGRQSDTRLVKPLQQYNSRIYGGYRIGEGNFPIYEDERITNEEGEYLFGFELSLLRDSLIDARRASLFNAELDQDIAEIELLLKQIGVQHDALYHYWKWVAAGKARDVYMELLDTAEKRQGGLEQKVERGDTARIFLTENQQNILKRRTQLVESDRILANQANELALYYRNGDGDLVTPEASQMPSGFPLNTFPMEEEKAIAALNARPELQVIANQLQQLEFDRRLGENALLPKADLGFEFSNDLGQGDDSRGTAESVVKLQVSIPLQRRFGEGKVKQANARIRQLEFEQRLLQDRLVTRVKNALVSLRTAEQFVALARQEAEAARTLEEAERVRFDDGQSDFFLLNMREEKTAEAKIGLISAHAQYQVALADLYALTLNKQALGLE